MRVWINNNNRDCVTNITKTIIIIISSENIFYSFNILKQTIIHNWFHNKVLLYKHTNDRHSPVKFKNTFKIINNLPNYYYSFSSPSFSRTIIKRSQNSSSLRARPLKKRALKLFVKCFTIIITAWIIHFFFSFCCEYFILINEYNMHYVELITMSRHFVAHFKWFISKNMCTFMKY